MLAAGGVNVEVWDSEDDCRDIGNGDGKVRNALRRFADWIYRGIDAEFDYQSADEQVDERIRANKYTFSKSGKREELTNGNKQNACEIVATEFKE